MKSNTDQPKVKEQKPDALEVLKSLPMPELQAKLGSSAGGLSQAETLNRIWVRTGAPEFCKFHIGERLWI